MQQTGVFGKEPEPRSLLLARVYGGEGLDVDFQRLDELAEKFMKDRKCHQYREIGSTYYHGKRVARGVIRLRGLVTADGGHDDILRCAAMFHDIAKGMKPHSHYGALLARDILKDELLPYELDEVCRLILAHGDRRNARKVHDIWVWLIQDADVLDHAGASEIWMSCNHASYRQKPITDVLEWYTQNFEQVIAKYRGRLNLDISRAILDSKADFERQFARRLMVESAGDYLDEDIPELQTICEV